MVLISCVFEHNILLIVQAGTTSIVLLCCVSVDKIRIVLLWLVPLLCFVVPVSGLVLIAGQNMPMQHSKMQKDMKRKPRLLVIGGTIMQQIHAFWNMVVFIRVEPSTPQHSYSTATAVDIWSWFFKYSTAVKKELYSSTQHFTAVFTAVHSYFLKKVLKTKMKLWNWLQTKIF